ncbi:MAG: phage integrase N-terminal domain-containing protein [Steroidobacteraceae bacterium]
MTRSRNSGGKAAQVAGGWKAALAAVLKAHNGARHDGAVASFATRDKRADVLYAGFKRLHELNFRLETVMSLRGKHIEALVKDWHERGLSASTLQNNLSIFRTFAEWIGKAGMVRGIEHYLGPGTAARSSIARQDRSWSGQGIDVAAKIEQVRNRDERVALQLELQLAFGLRAREAMQLRPHLADKGTYLGITHGTKGGRDRVEPIRTPEQRALLERAKTFCATPSSSTSDPQRKLHQWKNHYYHVVRSRGVTRKEGIPSHGLRHAYAHVRYRELTGSDSPVQGGVPVDRDVDRAARSVVAEELGHSREGVTTHYLGRRNACNAAGRAGDAGRITSVLTEDEYPLSTDFQGGAQRIGVRRVSYCCARPRISCPESGRFVLPKQTVMFAKHVALMNRLDEVSAAAVSDRCE